MSTTDILLDPKSIEENQTIGTIIGSFSSVNTNELETFTYALVSGTGDIDNGSFSISTNDLLSGDIFDYNTKNIYSIRVRSTDSLSEYIEKQFYIFISKASNSGDKNIIISPTNDLAIADVKIYHIKTTEDGGIGRSTPFESGNISPYDNYC